MIKMIRRHFVRDLTNEILELIGCTSSGLPKDVEGLLARPY
jgi:hypothetical protein